MFDRKKIETEENDLKVVQENITKQLSIRTCSTVFRLFFQSSLCQGLGRDYLLYEIKLTFEALK